MKQILAIWKLVVSLNSSRRHFESTTIAPATFTYRHDTSVLEFKYLHAKRRGTGRNKQTVSTMPNVEDCGVVWTLLLLQKIGAIESAVDVWDGKEQLQVDAQHFENAESLRKLLDTAKKTLNEKQVRALENGDDRALDNLLDTMAKVHKTEDPVPIFLLPSNKHGEPSSKRMSSAAHDRLLRELGTRYGYVSSHQTYFGTTAARKGCIQTARTQSKELLSML